MNTNKITLILLLLFFTGGAGAVEKKEQLFPIHFSVLNESVSFPNFDFLKYSYNPSFMIGTEYLLKRKKNHDWHLTANLGYYYHKNWQVAGFINTEIGYRYKRKRWSFYSRLGVGYAHAFSTKPIYKFENGEFREAKNYGTPLFMGSLSVNIGYQVLKKEASPEIYFTYMSSVELPFNTYTGLHHFVGVGCKVYLFKKRQ